MKKLILLVLVIFGAWSYYTKNTKINGEPFYGKPASFENNEPGSSNKTQLQYQCDGRQHCSQMGSYEEAKFFIENCPNTKMDGDRDGVPCERQFGR